MNAAPAFVLAMLFATGGPFGGLEHSRRPPRIEAFWAGLDKPAEHADASGIIALREPLERRVRIAGGHFVMGSTPQERGKAAELCAREPTGDADRCTDGSGMGGWIAAEGHPHEVTLSDFDIDRVEVSVQRYARCVAAGACSPPSFPPSDARYDRADFPVTHVTWDDAVSYCRFAHGRLPTEAEWEHAARGRAGHIFPWGDLYNPHLANHGSQSIADPTDARDGFEGLAPIGSFPDGATSTGLLDMAGNAAEWVLDWYDRDEEGFGYKRAAQTNPKGPPFGAYGHVIRGGSFIRGAVWLRTAARFAGVTAARDVGFRCAYDVTAVAAPAPSP